MLLTFDQSYGLIEGQSLIFAVNFLARPAASVGDQAGLTSFVDFYKARYHAKLLLET